MLVCDNHTNTMCLWWDSNRKDEIVKTEDNLTKNFTKNEDVFDKNTITAGIYL